MGELIHSWSRRGHHLEFAAGVTLGYATLGQVGFVGRVDYAAVGPVVDLAEVSSAHALHGQVLITQSVYAAVQQHVEVSGLGQISLSGFARPVDVFNVENVRNPNENDAWEHDGVASRLSALSVREREVALLVARGLTNKQIAEELVISERTAEGHVDHIRDKLGVRNRAEVAVWVVQNGPTNQIDPRL